MRVRRRGSLVCRWEADGLRIGLPGQRRYVRVAPVVVDMLARASDWITLDALVDQVDAHQADQARATAETLVDLGLLVTGDTDRADAHQVPAVWRHWGPIAHRFQVESRDADYLVDPSRYTEVASHLVGEGTPPAPFKEYPAAPTVYLPRRPLPLRGFAEDVLAARRTHRRFADAPVSVDALATVLHYTFGPQRFLDGGQFGILQSRVSASAGGRHEVECYVAVFAVAHVPAGLYHYSPLRHALELLDPSVDRARIAELAYGQEPSYQGAFTCLTTAVAGRLAWKYRHPRAYRLWMYNAGHYGQTFALTCTALGLGAFQTVAFHDSTVEQMLAVNPEEEFAVYLLAAGVPDPSTGSVPVEPSPSPPGHVDVATADHPADTDRRDRGGPPPVDRPSSHRGGARD